MDAATKSVLFFGMIGLVIAGSMIAVFQVRPSSIPILTKDGTMSVYMGGIQSDISGNQDMTGVSQYTGLLASAKPNGILSLNVTIDSVSIHQSNAANESWTQISNTRFTFDLLKPFTVSKLIATSRVPQEYITMVRLHIAAASASVLGAPGVLAVKVPSDDLKLQVTPPIQVRAQLTSSITIAVSAHIVIEGNGQIKLTPELRTEETDGPE